MDYHDYMAGQTTRSSWFRAKNELVDLLCRQQLPERHLNILNLGAGTGDDVEVLHRHGNVYAIDINEQALGLIPDHLCIEKRACDACQLPYPDHFFDLVVSFDVFEHIENDTRAVAETFRVLKEEGILLFSVPAYPALFSAHDRALEHKRRYSKKMLNDLLENFHIVVIGYWNCLLFPFISIIRLCGKKAAPTVDRLILPPFIDRIVYLLLHVENLLVRRNFPLPWGLSLFGVCQKHKAP